MADVAANRRHARTELVSLLAAEALSRVSPHRLMRFGRPFSVPDHLLAAPQFVVPGDAPVGASLYAGTFALAGTTVEADGRSIFEIAPPTRDWARALHGFSWLADLAATDTVLARAYARALIEEWIGSGRARRDARRPEVAARRMLSWLTYAPFVLEGAEPGFQKLFLRSLARQAARLRREVRRTPLGMPRLLAAIALTEASLCLPDGARDLAIGSDRLAADLKALVLPDGGPATRNPGDLLALSLDLLPLAANFAARGLAPPPALMAALDRIMPMLRFFRHADGTLALFNGMGATRIDLLDAVLDLDDAKGRPVLNAGFSSYQRMEGGATVVIADTGRPPPLALSRAAHAGALSFEMSAGTSRIVVNCGAPEDGSAARRMAARKTAAHSTAVVGETSSARFVRGRLLTRLLGPLLRDGPRKIDVQREDGTGNLLRASHDGYLARLGLIHERTLRLDAKGERLDGADVLRPARQGAAADIVVAFHLHPDVRTSVLENGRAVLLMLPDGDLWLFSAEGETAALEESIFFASPGGPRRSEQIVLRLGRRPGARVAWSFARTGHEGATRGLDLS